MSRDSVRVPKTRCLNCGAPIDMLGTGDPQVEIHPHPGDAAVCIRCGAVMLLDDQLSLRGMTDAEMDALVADHEWMNETARLVQKIYFVRGKLN